MPVELTCAASGAAARHNTIATAATASLAPAARMPCRRPPRHAAAALAFATALPSMGASRKGADNLEVFGTKIGMVSTCEIEVGDRPRLVGRYARSAR